MSRVGPHAWSEMLLPNVVLRLPESGLSKNQITINRNQRRETLGYWNWSRSEGKKEVKVMHQEGKHCIKASDLLKQKRKVKLKGQRTIEYNILLLHILRGAQIPMLITSSRVWWESSAQPHVQVYQQGVQATRHPSITPNPASSSAPHRRGRFQNKQTKPNKTTNKPTHAPHHHKKNPKTTTKKPQNPPHTQSTTQPPPTCDGLCQHQSMTSEAEGSKEEQV